MDFTRNHVRGMLLYTQIKVHYTNPNGIRTVSDSMDLSKVCQEEETVWIMQL